MIFCFVFNIKATSKSEVINPNKEIDIQVCIVKLA